MFRHILPVFRFYSISHSNLLTIKRSVSSLPFVNMTNSSSNNHGTVKQIGTHDGIFHTDDAMACYMLTRLPEYRNATIVRSRDNSVLDKCDILVDVGSVYDHSNKRYDHHQREFKHTMNTLDPKKKFHIKLSSAGLIYFHYGRQIISEMLDIIDDKEQVEIIFDRLYESLVQEVDGIDNGVEMFDGEPRYRINTHLDDRVRRLIPPWTKPQTDEILLERFHEAMKLTGQEFEYRLNFISKVWHPARMIVEEAINNREKVHSSGEIIELPSGGVPWKEHIFTLEKEKDLEGLIKFAIFENPARKYWQIVGTPVAPKSFLLRVPLHHEWRGLRDEQLSEKSGIPGCVFVHTSGFTGANATREGLVEMAVKSLKEANSGGDMI